MKRIMMNAKHKLGFSSPAEVLELLASQPSPETILALRPSEKLQKRVSHLVAKIQNKELTPEETQEWEQYEHLELLVRMAKCRASVKLQYRLYNSRTH